MPRSGAGIHFCEGCEAKGVQTHVAPGHKLCAQCLEEARVSADSGIAPTKLMEVESQGEQTFQAALYAILGGLIGGAFVAYEMTRWEYWSYRWHQQHIPAAYYALIAGLAALIGAVVGWFVGLKRPPWQSAA